MLIYAGGWTDRESWLHLQLGTATMMRCVQFRQQHVLRHPAYPQGLGSCLFATTSEREVGWGYISKFETRGQEGQALRASGKWGIAAARRSRPAVTKRGI